MDGEKISMNFNQPHSPSIIQGENANEKYLLLPVRLKDAA
jgi:DNA polymerase III sliding clamp (beta) subunit (PCNA family)